MIFGRHPSIITAGHRVDYVLPDLIETLTLDLQLPDPAILVPDPRLGLLESALCVNDLLLKFCVPLLQPLYIVGLIVQLLLQFIDHMLIL
jgi:hypothetical protein